MKFFYSLLFAILLQTSLYAGAPAPKTNMPTPPFNFKNGKLLSIQIKWEKKDVLSLIPQEYIDDDIVKGGIAIFSSKLKQAFNPVTFSYAWIDIKTRDNKKSRYIIFGVFGPDEDLNFIMQNTYFTKTKLGKNRITNINNKVSARVNINKKITLSANAEITDNCKKDFGELLIASNLQKKNMTFYHKVEWESSNVCLVKNIKLKNIKKYVNLNIDKIINGQIYDNINLTYNMPIALD